MRGGRKKWDTVLAAMSVYLGPEQLPRSVTGQSITEETHSPTLKAPKLYNVLVDGVMVEVAEEKKNTGSKAKEDRIGTQHHYLIN